MYNKNPIDRICPDCGGNLSPRATYCGCGWGKKKGFKSEPLDTQCSYENDGRRCQFPGASSFSTLGGGPWYCRIHIAERGNQIASQALDESQHAKSSAPKNDDLTDLTWLTENFPMRSNETRQEYNMRCKDHALSMLKGFRPKPVVSSGLSPVEKPDVRSGELVEF